ncbi:glycosyltransferase family 2 protein [Mucilaginibacter endophyticus]|uniref:glycosyltransferase family 2 protein n=1 Tax=Mucilaginibacter endophyticus TaxID=2675003 RepID=UPI000E0DD112|nr:glycosyltransferase [Mucilaginibacter endophyticus]
MEETDLSPLVSIIIPVYNSALYLAEAINSCVNQTWQNIEVIIIDDGSTDESLSIAKTFENKRIRVYHQENKNAAAARNSGLMKAKGDYIQFLDADDILSADKIEKQVTLLAANPGMVAVCSTIHFTDGHQPAEFEPSAYEEAFLLNLPPFDFLFNLYGGNNEGKGSMVQPNAWLCPKNIIEKAGKWNEELTLDDDGEYFCRVVLASKGVLKSDGYNYYRKYQGHKNLSGLATQQHLRSQYDALSLKISWLQAKKTLPELKNMHARWLHGLLFKAYPAAPELMRQIKNDLKTLKASIRPEYPFGTTSGKLLSMVFGWKFAKRLQLFKHQLSKRPENSGKLS